jgi:rare lipoprotein A
MLRRALLALLLALIPACAPRAAHAETQVAATPIQEGIASWYGREFAGRRTASGEVFDPSQLTAAHRTLPFGTLVRVTHVGSGRSVVVRINDRGPFTDRRVIDLSHAAAAEIGMVAAGTARVRIEPIDAAPALRLAPDPTLAANDARSAHHAVGTLLLLRSGDESAIVRVVPGEPPLGVDLTVDPDLYRSFGPLAVALSASPDAGGG